MPEDYKAALWCIKKHLLLAKTHLGEAMEKLARDIESNKVSKTTRLSAEDAVRNLIAAEEHITDVLSQNPNMKDDLVEMMDEIRKLRQQIASTGLPFRVDIEVDKNSVDVIDKAKLEVDKLLDEIDRAAVEMRQEQLDCIKCEDDMLGGIMKDIVEGNCDISNIDQIDDDEFKRKVDELMDRLDKIKERKSSNKSIFSMLSDVLSEIIGDDDNPNDDHDKPTGGDYYEY